MLCSLALLTTSFRSSIPSNWVARRTSIPVTSYFMRDGIEDVCVESAGRYVFTHLHRIDPKNGRWELLHVYGARHEEKELFWAVLGGAKPVGFSQKDTLIDIAGHLMFMAKGDHLVMDVYPSTRDLGLQGGFLSTKIGSAGVPVSHTLPALLKNEVGWFTQTGGKATFRRGGESRTVYLPRELSSTPLVENKILWKPKLAYLGWKHLYLVDFSKKRAVVKIVPLVPNARTRRRGYLADGSYYEVMEHEVQPGSFTYSYDTYIYSPRQHRWKHYPDLNIFGTSAGGDLVCFVRKPSRMLEIAKVTQP